MLRHPFLGYTESRTDRRSRRRPVCFFVRLTEALQKERAEKEEQWLQELDEDEYDALPEEEKERVVKLYRDKLRQKKLRYWLPSQIQTLSHLD